eukprot:TRINITY_DN3114_c0_g1_i3.p1 TRINITY_DN3114_c0_g1~~TRINITY_DN3114_c0_g1_i3.p1  ORF type:complete len:544 (-),score=165.02 TRINITY_DN3114_c0_g1_i3:122-1753(-)
MSIVTELPPQERLLHPKEEVQEEKIDKDSFDKKESVGNSSSNSGKEDNATLTMNSINNNAAAGGLNNNNSTSGSSFGALNNSNSNVHHSNFTLLHPTPRHVHHLLPRPVHLVPMHHHPHVQLPIPHHPHHQHVHPPHHSHVHPVQMGLHPSHLTDYLNMSWAGNNAFIQHGHTHMHPHPYMAQNSSPFHQHAHHFVQTQNCNTNCFGPEQGDSKEDSNDANLRPKIEDAKDSPNGNTSPAEVVDIDEDDNDDAPEHEIEEDQSMDEDQEEKQPESASGSPTQPNSDPIHKSKTNSTTKHAGNRSKNRNSVKKRESSPQDLSKSSSSTQNESDSTDGGIEEHPFSSSTSTKAALADKLHSLKPTAPIRKTSIIRPKPINIVKSAPLNNATILTANGITSFAELGVIPILPNLATDSRQEAKNIADLLTEVPGLEKIRWQSILQSTRGPEVGDREIQRRVKEAEILGARLFGGDLDKLLSSLLNQHLDFLVHYVRTGLATKKRRHKKIRDSLWTALTEMKEKDTIEGQEQMIGTARIQDMQNNGN